MKAITVPDRSTSLHLWLVLMKAHRTMIRHAERSIEALDMCLSDFGVLELLLHKGPQRLTDIGRKVALTSGATTIAVDRLEARKLVARSFEDGDRRARVVTLTRAGDKLIRRVFAGHTRAMEDAVSGLSKSEVATLTQLLKKLGTSADEQLVAEPGFATKGLHP
jgi:MarR family transcriptional regulator, 2-MHQ and catechol-resistance regulon repressor